jgi:hypothetical protein
MKIDCDSCLKKREPYFKGSNLCEECANKFDNLSEGVKND